MTSTWSDTFCYYLGYEIEVTPSERTVRLRHLLMEQVRKSNLKLTPPTETQKKDAVRRRRKYLKRSQTALKT